MNSKTDDAHTHTMFHAFYSNNYWIMNWEKLNYEIPFPNRIRDVSRVSRVGINFAIDVEKWFDRFAMGTENVALIAVANRFVSIQGNWTDGGMICWSPPSDEIKSTLLIIKPQNLHWNYTNVFIETNKRRHIAQVGCVSLAVVGLVPAPFHQH